MLTSSLQKSAKMRSAYCIGTTGTVLYCQHNVIYRIDTTGKVLYCVFHAGVIFAEVCKDDVSIKDTIRDSAGGVKMVDCKDSMLLLSFIGLGHYYAAPSYILICYLLWLKGLLPSLLMVEKRGRFMIEKIQNFDHFDATSWIAVVHRTGRLFCGSELPNARPPHTLRQH